MNSDKCYSNRVKRDCYCVYAEEFDVVIMICLAAGHLSFECFNTLRTNPQQEVIVDVGSTSSDSDDDELPTAGTSGVKGAQKYSDKGMF